jgi:hypothetical protein
MTVDDGQGAEPNGICQQTAESGVVVAARRSGKNTRHIAQFNRVCPVGSPVLYWPGDRRDEGRRSVTRSEAWLLGGHTPVVMVDGYSGGIALTHVVPFPPEEPVSRPEAVNRG